MHVCDENIQKNVTLSLTGGLELRPYHGLTITARLPMRLGSDNIEGYQNLPQGHFHLVSPPRTELNQHT